MPAKEAEVALAEADHGTDLASASAESAEDGFREQEHLHPEGLALGAQSGGPGRSAKAQRGSADPEGDEALSIEAAERRRRSMFSKSKNSPPDGAERA